MRFTKLRLNGFKSFVDPTDLVIGDGLTGVVGPNGCGKSNLLEALRWVMGETRPSAMRGGGMEDVIFAGAASRPARNFAEVALVIDNSERLAPSGFNEADALEIIRRITRDAGSAYKVNTKDVRARDVSMLFADASTGAHSPALVRQGQISELINAKPKNRRRILEEAAGISGLYQRRHEAELKLKGAETNLARVDDVIEQLAGQLASLARQARQAARYREIGTELRQAEGLLLYRKWREADDHRAQADEALRQRVRQAGEAEKIARDAGARRSAQEEMLPPLREEEAIATAVLQRLVVQRDALGEEEARARDLIATLTGRVDQLTRDIEREEVLNRDANDTIARLDWEKIELGKAAEGHAGKLEAAQDVASEASDVLSEREALLSELTEDVARLAARHQSASRLCDENRRGWETSQAEASAARDAVDAARATLAQAADKQAEAEDQQDAARDAAQEAEDRLASAEDARAQFQAREQEARAARSQSEGEVGALRAEVGALAKLLERDRGEGTAMLDLIRVVAGFEQALGAALSDDLRQPLTSDTTASGWAQLTPFDASAPLPAQARALSEVVSGPAALSRRLSQVGIVDAAAGADLQDSLTAGQCLVSVSGDFWRWDGLRASAADAPSAAALRLQQLNRLEDLKQELARAEAQAQGTIQAHEHLKSALADATEADRQAREARRDADRALSEAARTLSRVEAERAMAAGRVETLGLSVTRHSADAQAAEQRLREAEATRAALPDLEGARSEVDQVKMTVEAARITMMTRRSAFDEIRREGDARTRRSQEVTKELSGWRHRLDTATTRIGELAERKEVSVEQLEEARALPEDIEDKRADLQERIDAAQARRAAAADKLALAETALRESAQLEREAERLAGEARETRAAAEARASAARDTVQAAVDRIREDLDLSPKALVDSLTGDPDAFSDSEAIETEVNRLKRLRDSLGAVNLRAEDDAREVQSEHDTLKTEKLDLEEAIKTLRAGIASLNREGRERLLTAFEQVNTNFAMLFTHLFNGGEAKLALVESDDPLDAGLEILCQPPGKKLSTLSLLSGGEQTLTALALIFAVFLANPAPICVLDEVDAPLDDANVTRFCDMLDEMTKQTDTRFLVITHHAVTMARMDRLFGVTMQEQGVSQLVSVDLKRAEAMVA
ncbi:Chromosome partition protein Smc [Aquimixticola soesokkakensis]|uniref:Chromosome partition protein Smc n=1 Tax=Aquimixticola soesokkakensis TaxID=1519096 RepID=A0A1Y5RKL8_9RHOB|nr:chromosome segregation protein SMC [Aquimixticola soesokkakensis]SLN16956.1 Chromosome partition protein Smc [Aquimixticola soesokkakensis]